MSDDVEAIVRGLTKAQRDGLARIDLGPTRVLPIAALHRATWKALERRGLAAHYIFAMISCAVITPLGLRVRQSLLSSPVKE